MTDKKIKGAILELDLDGSFLTHSTTASGSGFLKNWRKDGMIVVWLHPQAPVPSVWLHSWPKYVTDIDEETEQEYEKIVHPRMLCLENEKLLKRQFWREKDGSRTIPPTICPIDLCIEWVRGQIGAGKFDWTTPIFKWETAEVKGAEDLGGDEEVFYAGGLTGLFGKREKTREELAMMHSVDAKESEAYLQDCHARMQYLMAVLSDSDLDAGWVVTFESKTLGNKLKKEIAAEIKRCEGNLQQGSPKYNPYPFEWTFDENKDFDEKYDVIAKSRTRPHGQVAELLAEDPPSFQRIYEDLFPKLGDLLDSMKDAAQVDMPFDQFFEAAAKEFGMERSEAEGEEPEERTPEVGRTQVDSKASPAEDQPDTCDVCEAAMSDGELECRQCSATYQETTEGDIVLKTRPCGNDVGEGCMEKRVPVDEDGRAICPQCGTEHEQDAQGNWKVEVPKPIEDKPAAASGRRVRRRKPAAAPAEAEAEQKTEHADARPARRAQQRARAVTGK